MEATFQDHLDDCHGLPLRALLAERSGELEMMAGGLMKQLLKVRKPEIWVSLAGYKVSPPR
jgi:hypothetical protein